MKIAVIATAFVFLGFAAPTAWAETAAQPQQQGAQNQQMQDVSSRHRRWHRPHRAHRVCTTHWRHGRRVTVCRWR